MCVVAEGGRGTVWQAACASTGSRAAVCLYVRDAAKIERTLLAQPDVSSGRTPLLVDQPGHPRCINVDVMSYSGTRFANSTFNSSV